MLGNLIKIIYRNIMNFKINKKEYILEKKDEIFLINRFIFSSQDEDLLPPYVSEIEKKGTCYLCKQNKDLIKSHTFSKSWFKNQKELFYRENIINNNSYKIIFFIYKASDENYRIFRNNILKQDRFNFLYSITDDLKKYKDKAIVSAFTGICGKCDSNRYSSIDEDFDFNNSLHLELLIQRSMLFMYFDYKNFIGINDKNISICKKNMMNYNNFNYENLDYVLKKAKNNLTNVNLYSSKIPSHLSFSDREKIYDRIIEKSINLSIEDKENIISLYKGSYLNYYRNMLNFYKKIKYDYQDPDVFLKFADKIKNLKSKLLFIEEIDNLYFIGLSYCKVDEVFYAVLPYKKINVIYLAIGIEEKIELINKNSPTIKEDIHLKIKSSLLYYKKYNE